MKNLAAKNLKLILLSGALSFLAQAATAEPVVQKDWMTDQAIDELVQKDSCWAATNAVTGTHKGQLLVSFPKDRTSVPWLTLKLWTGLNPESKIFVRVSSKVSHALFLLKATTNAEEPSTYIYAPVGFQALLDVITGASKLNIQSAALPAPQTPVVQLQVSLSGSSAAIQATRKCLKSDVLLPSDFFKVLNTKTDLTNINPDQASEQLLKSVEAAFQTYLAGVAKKKELTDLQKTMKPMVTKETAALKVYNTALTKWQETSDNLDAQQLREKALQETLDLTTAELQRKETELPIAEADLKLKKSIYEPLRAQMDPLFKEVAAKQSSLDKTVKEIARLKKRIPQIEREISNLRSERSSVNSDIDSLERAIIPVRREFDDWDSQVRRFSVSSEVRNELSRHWQYDSAKRKIDEARRDADQARNEVSRSRSQESSIEGQLRTCRAADPAQDCSSLESQLRTQESHTRDFEQRENRARNEQSSAEREVENIENEVQRKVENELDRLEGERDSVGSRLDSLTSSLRSAQYRLSEIENEIPALQGELRRARANLPTLEASKPELEAALADAQLRRDQLSAQIGYVEAETNLQNATTRVADLKKGIADAKKLITKTQSDLKKIKPVIAQITKDLAKRLITRDQAAEKLRPLQDALKPSREIEAGLTAVLTQLNEQLNLHKATYQKIYELLLATPAT